MHLSASAKVGQGLAIDASNQSNNVAHDRQHTAPRNELASAPGMEKDKQQVPETSKGANPAMSCRRKKAGK